MRKKNKVQIWADPNIRKELKMIAVEEDKFMDDVLAEMVKERKKKRLRDDIFDI